MSLLLLNVSQIKSDLINTDVFLNIQITGGYECSYEILITI
jgi:hypothetical protein